MPKLIFEVELETEASQATAEEWVTKNMLLEVGMSIEQYLGLAPGGAKVDLRRLAKRR